MGASGLPAASTAVDVVTPDSCTVLNTFFSSAMISPRVLLWIGIQRV